MRSSENNFSFKMFETEREKWIILGEESESRLDFIF